MKSHPEYAKLTPAEQEQLNILIATGLTRMCKDAQASWFDVTLPSGKRFVGAYRWDSFRGQFAELKRMA